MLQKIDLTKDFGIVTGHTSIRYIQNELNYGFNKELIVEYTDSQIKMQQVRDAKKSKQLLNDEEVNNAK